MKVTVLMPRLTYEIERQQVLQLFAEEVVAKLMPSAKGKVTIKLTKTVLARHTVGRCADKGSTIHVDYELRSSELFETVAHELIHTSQWVNGQMDAWLASTPASTPYRDRPWEIDAFAREASVALDALNAINCKHRALLATFNRRYGLWA